MTKPKHKFSNLANPQEVEYVVHFRESRDELQWDETYFTKEEADRRAYEIYINGGIAVVVENIKPIIPETTSTEDHPDLENPDD